MDRGGAVMFAYSAPDCEPAMRPDRRTPEKIAWVYERELQPILERRARSF
jgi:hypothetical protein